MTLTYFLNTTRYVVTRRAHEHGHQVSSLSGRRAFLRPLFPHVRLGPSMETIVDPTRRLVSEGLPWRNGYIWVMAPQVTSESSAWRIFLRWYMMLNTKIVPPYKNDLKKHLRHRDRHGRQVESMVRLLGESLEPRVRHPSGKERRHHCLTKDLGAILVTRNNSVLFLNAWSCRFQLMRSCQATRILSPQAQTNSLRGRKQTLMLP